MVSYRLCGRDSVRLCGRDSVRLCGRDSVRLYGRDSTTFKCSYTYDSFPSPSSITIPTGQLSLVPEKNYSHIPGYMIHFHLMNLIIAIPPGPPSQANNYIANNSHRTGYMIHFHSMNSCHLTGQMIHFHSKNCCSFTPISKAIF